MKKGAYGCRWQRCVLCHGLNGVLYRARGDKNDDKRQKIKEQDTVSTMARDGGRSDGEVRSVPRLVRRTPYKAQDGLLRLCGIVS